MTCSYDCCCRKKVRDDRRNKVQDHKEGYVRYELSVTRNSKKSFRVSVFVYRWGDIDGWGWYSITASDSDSSYGIVPRKIRFQNFFKDLYDATQFVGRLEGWNVFLDTKDKDVEWQESQWKTLTTTVPRREQK